MVTINLREFYPWYKEDIFIDVTDEVAAELHADKRYERAYQRRMFYNDAHYSLDVDDGIEASADACHNDNPERVFDMKENHCRLCRALNSLPEIQGRRIEARYLLGKSVQDIAQTENVSESSVYESLERGLRAMKKYLSNSLSGCPEKCE